MWWGPGNSGGRLWVPRRLTGRGVWGFVCLRVLKRPIGLSNGGLMLGKVPLNGLSQWLGHANVQVALPTYLPIVVSDYGVENVGWRLQSSENDAGFVLWFVTDGGA